MNLKELTQYLPLIQAFAEGKTVQCRLHAEEEDEKWSAMDPSYEFHYPAAHYRVKPTEIYRPWTLLEVPIGALMRWRGRTDLLPRLIIGAAQNRDIDPLHIYFNSNILTGEGIVELWEWKPPFQDVPWQRCGVKVDP